MEVEALCGHERLRFKMLLQHGDQLVVRLVFGSVLRAQVPYESEVLLPITVRNDATFFLSLTLLARKNNSARSIYEEKSSFSGRYSCRLPMVGAAAILVANVVSLTDMIG